MTPHFKGNVRNVVHFPVLYEFVCFPIRFGMMVDGLSFQLECIQILYSFINPCQHPPTTTSNKRPTSCGDNLTRAPTPSLVITLLLPYKWGNCKAILTIPSSFYTFHPHFTPSLPRTTACFIDHLCGRFSVHYHQQTLQHSFIIFSKLIINLAKGST